MNAPIDEITDMAKCQAYDLLKCVANLGEIDEYSRIDTFKWRMFILLWQSWHTFDTLSASLLA